MTYDASIPVASASPASFPTQSQTNFSRLETIIGNDHQFNASAAANDGYHNLINMTTQSPSGVLANTGRLYVKSLGSYIQLYYMDDQGNEYLVTPGIVAACNFNGVAGAVFRGTPLNFSGVVRDGNGSYTLTFANALPDANYVVSITGMRNATGDVVKGFVLGDSTYSNSVTTTTLKIGFAGASDTFRDVLMGNVIVYRTT